MDVLDVVEQGLRFTQYRGAVLASDAANAGSPGFSASDVSPEFHLTDNGLRFAAAVHQVDARGPTTSVERAMAALAKNSLRFKALAAHAHALLREFRTVAEESRR